VNAFLKLFPLIAALAIAGCNAGGSPNTPTAGGPSQSGPSASAHFVPEWQSKHEARRVCKLRLLPVQWKLRLAAHRLADAL